MARRRKDAEIDFPIIDIRKGVVSDAEACQKMLRQHPKSFGFVTLLSLREAADKESLYIARVNGDMVGFVSFRACRDGWQTIYELCVDEAWHGKGVGRALLYSVPTPIRLKCPTDLEASNRFYKNAGMKLIDENTTDAEAHQWYCKHVNAMNAKDQAKARPLTLWAMRILTIHCQGNNKNVPGWANKAGMAYGTRHDNTARAWPFMLDINWKKVIWAEYLAKVQALRPVMAMAQDYEHPSQRERMLSQIADLRALGVLRIAVCPKFDGAVVDIPADCMVAVSVPSSYAGFIPQYSELSGRRVHLLGGSPNKITELIAQLDGAVVSADYNVHERNAQNGMIFDYGRWVHRSPIARKTADYDNQVPFSGKNIRVHINAAAEVKQLLLL